MHIILGLKTKDKALKPLQGSIVKGTRNGLDEVEERAFENHA